MIVQTQSLSKSFGANRALDAVSIAIPEGATGLLGPNGSGKTTMLRILLGLLPGEGKAQVLGLDPAREPLDVRTRVGYMPESECLIPGLPGLEVVAFLGRLSGMPRREALKRAHEVLFYVGLGEARYRHATEYSQGMQQRLKLAQALVHDPDLLFLDEPTNGLDPKGRAEMLALIGELAKEHGKNIVLSSHLLPDVEEVCQGVVVLRRGRLADQGSMADLTQGAARVWQVEIRGDLDALSRALQNRQGTLTPDRDATKGTVALADSEGTEVIFAAAREAGVQLRSLTPARRSLEDVFLDAVAEDEG